MKALAFAICVLASIARAAAPDEPIDIGTRPQLFVDDYLVDNRFAAKGSAREMVLRRFHAPVKHGDSAVLRDPDTVPSQHAFRYDRERGLFRLWYQAQIPLDGRMEKKPGAWPAYRHIRYAESKDGLHWTLPDLGLVEFRGSTHNNICFARLGQFTDARLIRTTGSGISSMRFLNETDMPEADRRGYKYLMTYTQRGGGKEEEEKTQVFLIGSHDGIRWDRERQMSILTGAISDGWCGMNYDPERGRYVSYAGRATATKAADTSHPATTIFCRTIASTASTPASSAASGGWSARRSGRRRKRGRALCCCRTRPIKKTGSPRT